MISRKIILTAALFLLLLGCQRTNPICPPESIKYLPASTELSVTSSIQDLTQIPTPVEVEIRGRTVSVDQVVRGPVCNGDWRGVVYVACDIEIYEWEQTPNFLQACDLTIEEGSIVYVAAHNDEPYYKGCSCHTGEIIDP